MKKIALIAVLAFAAGLNAQDAIPGGTILPVQLNSSVRSNKARPGRRISARVMQDVPVSASSKIRSGAKVTGRVVDVRPASAGTRAEISLRFDTVIAGKRRIPMVANLRALASMMEVSEAQVPKSGPDRGTSEYTWTTEQIGGEIDFHGQGVSHGSYIVGKSIADGVLVRVSARPGTECRGEVDGNDSVQALWVFSSDACGLYGYPHVILSDAGRSDPVGQITLRSTRGDLYLRGGSGMLLRVNNMAH